MAPDAHGHVDFGDEGFIVRFKYDPDVVARMKEIQRRRWLADRAVWVVEPHWPSARRLLHIASGLGWKISPKAREAEARLKSEDELLEYSVDVVHDNHGKAWFLCKVGSDDRLLRQVKALPGATWDGAWWVPTDWEQCCGPLLEIVQSNMQLEVSNAAWRLLEELEVDPYLRSSVSPDTETPPSATETQAVSVEARDEHRPLESEDLAAQTPHTGRRSKVTTRGRQPVPEPAKKHVS